MEFAYYCLENYKTYKSLTGEQVYHLFVQHGVFDYLKDFYDVLHTTGHKYTINDINLFLNSRSISI